MTLKLNSTYDLFIATARHVYANKNSAEDFEYPEYLGFKKAGNLPPDLILIIQDGLDHIRHGNWEELTERSFIEGCLSDIFHSNFYEEFVCKNQKLF